MRRFTAFFVFFVSFSVVYVSVAYYLLSPRPSQPFMGFGVYSESGTLSAYAGGFGLPVAEDQSIRWTLEVVNEMGVVQFSRLLYRIGNTTNGFPSNSSPSPEGVRILGWLESFIAKDETRKFEFTWTVLNKTQSGGSVYLDLLVNGTIWPQVAVSSGSFRFVFELWTFDLDSDSFQYGWSQESSRVGSWLQVWFNVV